MEPQPETFEMSGRTFQTHKAYGPVDKGIVIIDRVTGEPALVVSWEMPPHGTGDYQIVTLTDGEQTWERHIYGADWLGFPL